MRDVICMASLCFLFTALQTSFVHAQEVARIQYALTNDPIDVVIPSTKKDLYTLEACIAGIKRHAKNIRRVIVVSSERLTDHAEWFDEKLYPFSKRDIALQIFKTEEQAEAYLRSEKNRVGWKYQQLLKLYAAYVIPNISSNILILDSDTIFLRDVEFIDVTSRALFAVGKEYHTPYFEHMSRLLPSLQKIFPQHSGIAHHMLFQRAVLDDLFSRIREYHYTDPWRAICNVIDIKDLLGSCFSEYEIYFNFAFARSDQIKIRELKMLNIGECDDLEKFKEEGYDYVSCHAYLRAG